MSLRLLAESQYMVRRFKELFPGFKIEATNLTANSYLLNVSSSEFAGYGEPSKQNTVYWTKELISYVGDAPYKIELVGGHTGIITYGVVTEPGLLVLKLSYASNFR